MPTVSFTCEGNTNLRYSNNNTSTWTNGLGQQGNYNSSANRVAGMNLSGIEALIGKASGCNFTEIKITFRFDSAGAGAGSSKTMTFYGCTQNGLSGNSQSIRRANTLGAEIGGSSNFTVTSAYNASRTITFNDTTNPDVFKGIIHYWKTTGLWSIVSYRNDSTNGSSYSSNYMQFNRAIWEITYTKNTVISYGADEVWKPVQVHYGADGVWKVCEVYYGADGVWKPVTHG